MNSEQQQKHFSDFVDRQGKILFKKGNDYSNEDRLSNFKLAGSICGLTPAQNCLSLIATKVARLGVLLKNNSIPENESVSDSIIDLANYAALLHMIVIEEAIKKGVEIHYDKKDNAYTAKIDGFKTGIPVDKTYDHESQFH